MNTTPTLPQSLLELHEKHRGKYSDKWQIYLDIYDERLGPLRNKPVSLLEIGVQNGGSLELWAKFFENAKAIVGCDIDPRCAELRYTESKIAVVVGDANSDATEEKISNIEDCFDIIIDDGSHTSGDIVRTFARYYPRLNYDGLFVIEDLHCSYWRQFRGGLMSPVSSIEFLKRLVDIVNFEHWALPLRRQALFETFAAEYEVSFTDELWDSIHSVEFLNSVCIIKKQRPKKNVLGLRIVSGAEAIIDREELITANGRSLTPIWQISEQNPDLPKMPEKYIEELHGRLKEMRGLQERLTEKNELLESMVAVGEAAVKTAALKAENLEANLLETQYELAHVVARDRATTEEKVLWEREAQTWLREIDAMRSTHSWRLTAPLRVLRRFLSKRGSV